LFFLLSIIRQSAAFGKRKERIAGKKQKKRCEKQRFLKVCQA